MVEKNKCCGCSACYNICPKNCISMTEDELGFLYPHIDEAKCIKCGLCEKVCPALNDGEKANTPYAWGGHAASDIIRDSSSSGGIFTLLAENTISAGGVVYGAAMGKDLSSVQHIRIESTEGISKLRGSKYVQSDLNKCFSDVKANLDNGRNVLFSGTPCQIEGLKLYLRRDYENLLTVEVICHGTPAPKVFAKYIKYMMVKLNDSIKRIAFRDEIGGC